MSDQSKRTLTTADLAFLIEGFSKVFTTKQDLDDLREEFSHLPTKHEFYNKMDEVLGEVVDEREENTIQQAKLEDHGGRIEKIESKLSISY